MSSGYHMDVPAVTELAGTVERHAQRFSGLGGPMNAAAAPVHTGDTGIDADIKRLAELTGTVLATLGQVYGAQANAMSEMAQNFGQFDQQVAADQQQVVAEASHG